MAHGRPGATFTDPNVARAGLSVTEAREPGIADEVTRYGINDLGQAIAHGSAHGFVKILTVPGKDRILDVTIVGEHAGNPLAKDAPAKRHRLGLNKILRTVHTFPHAGRGQQASRRRLEARPCAAETAAVGGALPRLGAGMKHLSRRGWLRLASTTAASGGAMLRSRTAIAQAPGCDHAYAARTALLRKHVQLVRGGQATPVAYAGFAADRAALTVYLESLSAVTPAAFGGWTRAGHQAFLINAYNAFTVGLILICCPDLKSSNDVDSARTLQWIPLLGAKVSLEDIEHATLRKRGDCDDPRVHFAVNCASIGCPALREEAFVAARVDAQLDEQTLRFMSDRTRNRFNARRGRLELSKIFDWYGEDFRLGHRGIASLPAFAARYADQLADAPADRELVRTGTVHIVFTDHDWALSVAR